MHHLPLMEENTQRFSGVGSSPAGQDAGMQATVDGQVCTPSSCSRTSQ